MQLQLDIIQHLCSTYATILDQKKESKYKKKLSEKTNLVSFYIINNFLIAENQTNVYSVYLCNFYF